MRRPDASTLSTAYFGMVMATWIVSLAMLEAGPRWAAWGLSAIAISTLAGSLLIFNSEAAPFLHSIVPFMKCFAVFCRATGTWWIPMLPILGVWRHICNRFPLRHDPLCWGAVFPPGMNAESTHQMALASGFDFLEPLSTAFARIALAAWALTFGAWLRPLFAPPAGP